jgi:iron complex outermembrane recepter protein
MNIQPTAVAFHKAALLASLTACTFILLIGATTFAAPPAQARAVTHELNIPAQDLGDALKALSAAADEQLLFSQELVGGKQSTPVKGEYSTDEALGILLSGSGLKADRTPSGVLLIRTPAPTTTFLDGSEEGGAANEGKESLWQRLRLAQSNTQSPTRSDTPSSQGMQKANNTDESTPSASRIEEVIVTAQKREERLIDIPQSATVLTPDAIAKAGAVQFRDYADTVPGLTFMTSGAGNTQISLRGVTVGLDVGPTVGIYVDEVPYGSSTAFADGSRATVDIGLFDLDRIEVLRGPQGTLYGASTMGGLIKYVTKQPDVSAFAANVQTGISNTHDGGTSYLGALTVNAPIVTEKAALRANGYYSRDGGYIDNVALGRSDVNGSDIYGGRADLLLAPTDALSIRITGFAQDIARDGYGTADYAFTGTPLDGSLDQYRLLSEPFDQRFRTISSTVDYAFNWGSLTSISSYQTARSDAVTDLSLTSIPFCTFIGLTCSAVGAHGDITTDKYVQELRFASNASHVLEWLLGGFYSYETSDALSEFVLRDTAGQPAPNDLYEALLSSRYEEYAAFGDLTWHVTDEFSVTGGLRYANNRLQYETSASGIFASSTPLRRSSDDVSTYLANARYKFSDHAAAYLRYATGYRPGGPNLPASDPVTGLPLGPDTFEADRLKSYEIGFKTESADRRFGLEIAGYYIDWNNIQIRVARSNFAGISNAPGGAEVRGAELALTARPTDGFTLTGAFGYQDAKMSEADPDLQARKGERLPNVPDFTGALSVDYKLQMGSWQPRAGATVRYVSDRNSSFDSGRPTPQYHLPEYTVVDLRTGFMVGSVDIQLNVRNLFDERGELSAFNSRGVAEPAILQPRTIGLTASLDF